MPMSDNKKTTQQICICCSSEMHERNFYRGRSNVFDTSRYAICKNCTQRLGNKDIETFHEVLRVLNIPFIPEVYREAKTDENLTSHYLLRLNNPKKRHTNGVQYQDLQYSDSPTLQQITDTSEYIIADDEKLTRLASRFGDSWTPEELIEMDKELDEMIVQYGGSKDDLPTIDLYSDLVLFRWLSMKAYNNSDVKTGNDMAKMRAKLLKDNGMTLQDMRDKNNTDSLGAKIDFAEDRPIVPNKKYYDVDGIWYMFKKLIKHMERFIGADKSSVDEDYAEMQDYVDNNKHYSEDME